MITLAQLRLAMPYASPDRAALFLPHINTTFDEFGITSPLRQAAWFANIAVESGSLRYVRELATGAAYEGRADLGNTEPGDGRRFKGGGLPQITGRANYLACGEALGLDLIAHPELLEQPGPATRSGGWFWQTRNLDRHADAENFWTICKIWNGGTNGLDERIKGYIRARVALGV